MSQQRIEDKSADRKYFIITPQIVWALSRDTYDYTLWGVIKMIAGDDNECFVSTRNLAKLSMMSAGKVSDCRKFLLEKGLLDGELRRDPGYPLEVWHLRIPDLWPANMEWRTKLGDSLGARIAMKDEQRAARLANKRGRSPGERPPSPGERPLPPHERPPSPGEPKDIQKEIHQDIQKENIAPSAQISASAENEKPSQTDKGEQDANIAGASCKGEGGSSAHTKQGLRDLVRTLPGRTLPKHDFAHPIELPRKDGEDHRARDDEDNAIALFEEGITAELGGDAIGEMPEPTAAVSSIAAQGGDASPLRTPQDRGGDGPCQSAGSCRPDPVTKGGDDHVQEQESRVTQAGLRLPNSETGGRVGGKGNVKGGDGDGGRSVSGNDERSAYNETGGREGGKGLDMWDLTRRTKRAQQREGAWATPGEDALASFGLFCLYDKRGKRAPAQGTKAHGQQVAKVRESLKAYGYQQVADELVEKAAEIFCGRKGSWVNVHYASFVADFGDALQDAEHFLKHGHLPGSGATQTSPGPDVMAEATAMTLERLEHG